MSLKHIIVLFSIALFWSGQNCMNSEDFSLKTVWSIANTTWKLLPKVKDRKLGMVGNLDSVQKFFKRYQSDDPISYTVEVTEEEFLLGKVNGMDDYKITEDVARAVFRLFNLDYAAKLFIIDPDLRVLFAFCDHNWDKKITEKELQRGFYTVLRPLPFASIFLKYDADTDELLDKEEFYEMANSWDANGNAKINDMELMDWWTSGGYGDKKQGELFFKVLDYDQNGILDDRDLTNIWSKLTGNDTVVLDFDEFIRLDTMVNGVVDFRKTKEGKKKLVIHSGRFREFDIN